jgi:hypothetical protein
VSCLCNAGQYDAIATFDCVEPQDISVAMSSVDWCRRDPCATCASRILPHVSTNRVDASKRSCKATQSRSKHSAGSTACSAVEQPSTSAWRRDRRATDHWNAAQAPQKILEPFLDILRVILAQGPC